MFCDVRKVKYTQKDTYVTVYDNQLESWYGIDEIFKGLSIRDKVVCRVDLLESFDDFFSKETIEKYRPAIMYMATGQCQDPETLSSAIKELMENDETFRIKVSNIFYNLSDNESLGKTFLYKLAERFREADPEYRSYFRGRTEFVICVSDGYLYFSVADCNYDVELPRNFKVEVLSNARYWRGTIKVV